MMTTNKLTKTFASGSLAIGIAAVAGIVNAPSAHAACGIASISDWTGGTPVTCGDKIFTYVSGNILPRLTDALEIDKDAAGNYDFTYDLIPDYDSPNGASIKYTVEITDLKYSFDQIKLDSTTSGTVEQVTKLVAWNGGSQLLTSNGGGVDFFTVPDHVKFITVTDTINPNGGSVASFQNSFTQKTPEPGTILGLLAVGGLGMVSRFKKQK